MKVKKVKNWRKNPKYFDCGTIKMCVVGWGTPLAHYLYECEVEKTDRAIKSHKIIDRLNKT